MNQGILARKQLQDERITQNNQQSPQMVQLFMESILDGILDDIFSCPGDSKLPNQSPELQTYGNLHQVRVHTQFSDNLCGFHALLNSACLLSFLITQSNDFISTLTSSAKFWHYYSVFKDFLLREYPEKSDIKTINNMGPLDRPHLEFSIQHKQFPLLGDIQETSSKHGHSLFFTVFYYNFGIIQMSTEQVQELNHQIDSFKSSDCPKAITFYAGPNSHWLVLIAYQQRKDEQIQFYMMDPSNLPLNHLLDENIPALLEVIKVRKEERGQDTTSIDRESNTEAIAWSLRDRKNAIVLLQDFVLEKKRAEVVLVENEFKELIRTFEEYLPAWRQELVGKVHQLQNQFENSCIDEDKILSNVWVFMKEEYRPQVVQNDMAKPLRLYKQFIKQYFDKNLAKDVVNLIKGVILPATNKLQQQISSRVKLTKELKEDEATRDIDILIKWNSVSSEIIQILQETL